MPERLRVFSVKSLLISIIRAYKKFVSPFLVSFFGEACRFTPTCSEYVVQALEKYGTLKGISLGARRFLRCHPWGGSGHDPVK